MTVPVLEHLGFLASRRLAGIRVPDAPHFDNSASTAWFTDRLASARSYLEFGSGGSTVVAAKLGVDLVTVESDARFLGAVRSKIAENGWARANQLFRHVDIGRVSRWGRPVGAVTRKRLQKFARYSDVPPQCHEVLPDLVLVDGRFRVACALKMLYQHARRGDSDWLIVVDDYADRAEYRVLTEFADLELVGRMGVLTGVKSIAGLTETAIAWETVQD